MDLAPLQPLASRLLENVATSRPRFPAPQASLRVLGLRARFVGFRHYSFSAGNGFSGRLCSSQILKPVSGSRDLFDSLRGKLALDRDVISGCESWKSWLSEEDSDENLKQFDGFSKLPIKQAMSSSTHFNSLLEDSSGGVKTWEHIDTFNSFVTDVEGEESAIARAIPSSRKASKARQALLVVSSALLVVGVGLRFSTPALANPAASEAPVVSVEKLQENKMQKQEGASIGETNVGTGTSGESETAASSWAAKLGDDFWNGIETADGSLEELLKSYLEKYPTNVQALECLAHLLVEKEDMSQALKVLEKLVELEPNELEWKFMIAQAHEYRGDLEMAKKGFEELLRLQPFSSRVLQGLIVVMDQTGEEGAALELIETALTRARHEDKVVEARNLRMLIGQFHTLKGNLDEALQHYKDLIDEDPNDFRPYLCQGLVYSVLGEKDEAEQQFKKYQQLCPKDCPNRSYLNELMFKAKNEGRKMHDLKQKVSGSAAKGNETKPMTQPSVMGEDSSDPKSLGE